MKAIWNNEIIATSNDTVVIEGNHYFPLNSVNKAYLKDSSTHTVCPWKGTASYYNLEINGMENKDAVWFYPTPSKLADAVKGRVAFWKGVKVIAD